MAESSQLLIVIYLKRIMPARREVEAKHFRRARIMSSSRGNIPLKIVGMMMPKWRSKWPLFSREK